MQQPSLTNIRLRSVDDAQVILYAADLGRVSLITRRLDSEERRALRPGNVYVWRDRRYQQDLGGLGMERWTDGKKWTASRTRDEFLYYYEQARKGTEPPSPENQLIKQTYSCHINAPFPKGPYKIFLITYFTQDSLRYLRTIEDIPELRELRVPEGLFARERKNSGKRCALTSYDGSNASLPSPSRRHSDPHRRHSAYHRTYAPYPAPNFAPAPYYAPHLEYEHATALIPPFDPAAAFHGHARPYCSCGADVCDSSSSIPLVAGEAHGSPPHGYYAATAQPGPSSPSYGHPSFYPFPGSANSESEYSYESNDSSMHTTPPPRRSNSVPSEPARVMWGSEPSSSPVFHHAQSAFLPNGSHLTEEGSDGYSDEGDGLEAVSLAPLSSLKRDAARRDPIDDRALMLLNQSNDFV